MSLSPRTQLTLRIPSAAPPSPSTRRYKQLAAEQARDCDKNGINKKSVTKQKTKSKDSHEAKTVTMPHIVSCTYDHGEVKRENLMRKQVDSTLHFLAERQKKLMRRLRTGEELAASPHFNFVTGGIDEFAEEEDKPWGPEKKHPEEDSVWNTTYKMNFNQSNSASAGLTALHLPPISGRKQLVSREIVSRTYPPRWGCIS